MIPQASELKEELALRRAIEVAAQSAENPESAEIQSLVLLDLVKFELEVARRERRSARTSVDIPFNLRERHIPSLNQLRQFLIARGYSINLGNDFVTISWN